MRNIGTGLFAVACACWVCGCSAPVACKQQIWGLDPNLEGERLPGTESLDETSLVVRRALELKLSNLPELWQGDGNIYGGYVAFSITTEYAGEPKGNDGNTQMPKVSAELSLDGSEKTVTASTSSFAFGSSNSPRLTLFDTCDNAGTGPGCCAYGSRECTVPLSLSVKRLDGAPFPAVNVAWSVESAASVTSCPLEKQVQVGLTVSEVSP